MEWITSSQFVEMLKRFPDTKIAARQYLGSLDDSRQIWEYHADGNVLLHYVGENKYEMTECDFMESYGNAHWQPDDFFHLSDERQKSLAVRIVEHLIQTGNLDWILTECNINFVRECQHCHGLMDEGWLCGDTYTFCSDDCLLKENPSLDKETLEQLYEDDDSNVCWNEWGA